jgi:lipopolysaccharide transport system ATP-binding protein
MNEPAITVQELSKKYVLGQHHTDLLSEKLGNIFRRRPSSSLQPTKTDFWALRDLTFEVGWGDVVGIIGRNGAGKSTLLKILSRITWPTAGRAVVRGRLASLLEVGTGFHPELTGRENVYLNGTILGMRRREIDRKFDEIVAFAGVERFLDTPVKRFSSGMYVRLAFAVAAHIEADILVIDEVLAVGDAEFQRRCLGKMGEVARGGRTVLFVSHNMAALRALCTRGLVLDRGQLVLASTIGAAASLYENHNMQQKASVWTRESDATSRPLSIARVAAAVAGQQPSLTLSVDITLDSVSQHRPSFVAIDITDSAGVGILQAIPTLQGFLAFTSTRQRITVVIDLPPLIPGDYLAGVWVGPHNTETLDEVKEAVTFEVHDSPTPQRTFPHTKDHGYIVPFSRVASHDVVTV